MREENLFGNKGVQFLTSKLQRPLTQFENDICMFPRVCFVSGKANPCDQLKVGKFRKQNWQ